MRLLYVCSDFGVPPDGTKGAAIHLRAITRGLAQLGHEVHLLSPKDGPGADHPARRLLPAGCPLVDDSGRMLKDWLVDHGFAATLAQEFRPLLYNAWVRERALAALAGAPPEAIVERLTLLGHVGVDLATALDVPLIVEANALLVDEARAFRRLQLERLAAEIENRVLHRADAILAVSAPLADRVAGLGIARDKIHVVPNGADLAAFAQPPPPEECRAALGLRDEFVIGFAGSLKPWHGVDVLLAAFARFLATVPGSRLLLVGTGPAGAALRASAAELGIDRAVIFTGAVPHERVPRMLGAMDVAVAPFKSQEGFYFSPIKLFEYMAAGRCVVASRLGQISEVITHNRHGLLCAPDSPESLLGVLQEAHRSGELRRRLGEAARELVREKYTWERTARATAGIVEETVARYRRRSMDEHPNLARESPPVEVSI